VPESARDAILARVAGLSARARGVVEAMALVGVRTTGKLLADVAPCPPIVLDEIARSGLVVEEGSWLVYRHEIARMAVEATVPPHRRRAIHQRILNALVATGSDDDAAMAFHAEEAGDEAATLQHAGAAARHAAELGSHREAATQYARALRFARSADQATIAALHLGRATQLSFVDLWHDATEEYERALELWRALGDRLHEGRTLRELSRAMWRLCRGADSVVTGEAAVRVLEPLGPSAELAWAYANLATISCFHGSPAGMALARSTQEMAATLGLTDVLSEALNTEGCALVTAGLPWREPMDRALDVALAGGHAGAAGRAYANLYDILADQRRFAEAERFFDEGMRYCDDRDLATFSLCLRGRRTMALTLTGQWDEAAALSVELLLQPASPVNRINPWTALGLVRARRDDHAAWECMEQAIAAAESTGEAQWVVRVRLARAEAHWLAGDLDAASHELELASAWWADLGVWHRGELATWRRRLALPPPDVATSGDGGIAPPYELQLRGAGEQAAQSFMDLGSPYEAALALLDTGEEEPLRRALKILTQLGAPATARQVRQRLRRLGVRSVPRGAQAATRAHPLGLTRREREVLDLICEGCSNAEIATSLVLSVKTVDHHVSAVLAKLGAPTRQAAARTAARLGVAGRPQTG
jgi:DNA-binding CsgD family transcriptional regulator/tetratricopeptide (TPR) repeat protein